MERMDLETWTDDEHQIAIRTSGDTGLFSSKKEVPPGTFAYLPHSEEEGSILESGEPIPADSQAILIKYGEFPLSFYCEHLSSADEYLFSANLTLICRVDTREEYLSGFYRNLMARATSCSLDTIRQYLRYSVKAALSSFVSEREASDLFEFEDVAGIEEVLKEELQEVFFTRGLEYRALGNLEFHSDSYEEELERREEEKERILQHEESLQEQKRKEEKLKRVLELLKEGAGNELLSEVEDRRVRQLLYRTLIDEDLLGTDEGERELSKRLDREAREVILTALQRLSREGGTDGPAAADALPETRTTSVFAVFGTTVARFSPDGLSVEETLDLEEPLRSVQVTGNAPRDESVLLVGSKQGVFEVSLTDLETTVFYRLPDRDGVRGGVNAATVVGNDVLATHSEYGVARWNYEHPDRPELLHEQETVSSRTTRAVTRLNDSIYGFLSGSRLYLGTVHNRETAVGLEPGLPAEGTDLVRTENGMYAAAGHRLSGGVLTWPVLDIPEAPERARELLEPYVQHEGTTILRKREPVTSIDLATVSGVPHLFHATRNGRATARMLHTGMETVFNAGDYDVEGVAGSSRGVFGRTRSGRFLLRWDPGNSDEPASVVDTMTFGDNPVFDLAIRTEPESDAS